MQQSDCLSQMMILKLPDINSDDENRQCRRRAKDLSRPTNVIAYVLATLKQVEDTLLMGHADFTETIIDELADITELITFFVLPKRSDSDKTKSPNG